MRQRYITRKIKFLEVKYIEGFLNSGSKQYRVINTPLFNTEKEVMAYIDKYYKKNALISYVDKIISMHIKERLYRMRIEDFIRNAVDITEI